MISRYITYLSERLVDPQCSDTLYTVQQEENILVLTSWRQYSHNTTLHRGTAFQNIFLSEVSQSSITIILRFCLALVIFFLSSTASMLGRRRALVDWSACGCFRRRTAGACCHSVVICITVSHKPKSRDKRHTDKCHSPNILKSPKEKQIGTE